MDFEYIPKTNADHNFGYIKDVDKFYSFVEEFSIVGVHWSEPSMISASYLIRLLAEGASARARGYDSNRHENDENSSDMNEFRMPLFDHCAMWKQSNGSVFCTAMPYGNTEKIRDSFNKLIDKYNYPSTIKMLFLDDKYRYRPNGDCMIIIYFDATQEEFDPNSTDEEVYRKAVQHSAPVAMRSQTVRNTFVRDRYVSEYAKRRANGYCQLCGSPAPFIDKNGKPFLETHHVIWLTEGGSDSVDNTVALCPNCHRKMHSLNLDEDVQALLQVVKTMR